MLRNLCVCAVLMLAGAAAAGACSDPDAPKTTEQKFAKATTVFVAHMIRTEEIERTPVAGDKTWPIIEGTFRVIEVLKGRPPDDSKVRSLALGIGNCSIPLLAGWDYVFFLGPSDNKHNLVWLPTGSFGTFNLDATDVKRMLEELRKLSDQTK